MFKWLQEKASTVASLIIGIDRDRVVWEQENFDKYYSEGYEKNIIVFKCIDDISSAVSSIPCKVGRLDSKGAFIEDVRHPLNEIMKRPNPFTARSKLIKELVGFYLLTGNGYLENVPGFDKRTPVELWSKNPKNMKVMPGGKWIRGYIFENGGERSEPWDIDPRTGQSNILHLKTFNPCSDWYGMPPLKAAAINVDQHNEGDNWIYNLYKNGSVLPGILKIENTVSETVFQKIKREVKNWRGARAVGEVPVLQGGVDFKQVGLSPQQIEFEKNKETTSRLICHAFGYPPFLLGFPEGSTFNNMAEARMFLWENTVIPLSDWIYEEISNWLSLRYADERLMVIPDYDDIPALEGKREKAWERMQSSSFVTDDEKRERVKLPPLGRGANSIYKPASEVPVAGELEDEE